MIVQVSSCLLRIFEKNNFSFRFPSRHFIVVSFYQKRIYCEEMDGHELGKQQKHSFFSCIFETQLNTPYDQPII